MTAHMPTCRIMQVLRTFPCLAEKYLDWDQECFDPDELIGRLSRLSHGEYACASFILTVWNPGHAESQPWEFRLMDFMARADLEHRMALVKWIEHPVWP
jgi:hypothetical protein